MEVQPRNRSNSGGYCLRGSPVRRIDAGEAADNLTNLWSAWRALEKARDDRDPLALELPERRVVLNSHGKIAEIALRENGSMPTGWSRIS